jgi:hypothetical protein
VGHPDRAVHRVLARAARDVTEGRDASTTESDPPDSVVVETAAEAAEELIFTRLDPEEVADLDVTVRYEDGLLEVDVYLEAPTVSVAVSEVADDAALAARAAVDQLLE